MHGASDSSLKVTDPALSGTVRGMVTEDRWKGVGEWVRVRRTTILSKLLREAMN